MLASLQDKIKGRVKIYSTTGLSVYPTVSIVNFVNMLNKKKKARETRGVQYRCTFVIVIWTLLRAVG